MTRDLPFVLLTERQVGWDMATLSNIAGDLRALGRSFQQGPVSVADYESFSKQADQLQDIAARLMQLLGTKPVGLPR